MYAKVFNQIFDSSIADDYRLRHFFMDLLVLADRNGVVDMTPTAIAARTRIPLDDVLAMLAKLELPDPESRTPDHDGRRIARLDDHRTWGWCIINYNRFREIVKEEQRREKTRIRTEKWREKKAGDAPVTHGDAGDAMQKQAEMEKKKEVGHHSPVKNPLSKSAALEKTTAGKLTSAERISLEKEMERNTKRMKEFGSLSPQYDGEKIRQRNELLARNAQIEKAIRIPL